MASLRFWHLVAAAGLVACGGSGGNNKMDAGGGGGGDAGGADAGSDQVAEGTLCTGTGSGDQDLCGGGDSDFECVSLPPSPHFFCTLGCGTGPCGGSATSGSDASCATGSGSDAPVAPADGDAMCEQAAQAAGGTGSVRCVLFAADPQGSGQDSIDWACGILCGTQGSGGSDFGGCPTGLTCTQNICR